MEQVLSVIGNPATRSLEPEIAERLRGVLEGDGAETAVPTWLCPGIACEIAFACKDPGLTAHPLREACAELPFDIAIQPREGRRKALLVADMESTIIAQEMVDEMAARFGIGDKVAAITRRTMAGEMPFEEALKARVALLAGFSEEDLTALAAIMTLNPGAATLVATMRHHGATCALVSGGFSVFVEIIARRCGFDHFRANQLELRDGQLTGRLVEPIQGPDGKARALEGFARDLDKTAHDSIAVGDGSNDLEMVRDAGLGVAYRGKAVLKAVADVPLEHGDLSALLYLQGYHRDQFVTLE